jgi:hypothetical protein
MSKCDHSAPQWHLADCNEDGWKCAECERPLGFRPDLDREHTDEKVETILFWLVEHDFIYVSNASEASGVVAQIVNSCHASNTYDQQSIVHAIAAFGLARHQAFWRDQAKQGMCSHPSRGLSSDETALVCHACRHELKVKKGSGPLFDAGEPF